MTLEHEIKMLHELSREKYEEQGDRLSSYWGTPVSGTSYAGEAWHEPRVTGMIEHRPRS